MENIWLKLSFEHVESGKKQLRNYAQYKYPTIPAWTRKYE